MKFKWTHTIVLASMMAALVGQVQAQTPAGTPMKMDRETFLSMVYWDEMIGNWVLRPGMEPPAGVLSRKDVLAMRDDWLKMNRWDETNSIWIPLGKARDMSTLTRDQVRMETIMFLMTYKWDEAKSEWTPKRR
jgi:hypothetical protein